MQGDGSVKTILLRPFYSMPECCFDSLGPFVVRSRVIEVSSLCACLLSIFSSLFLLCTIGFVHEVVC
jgi:hypothetical protein